MLPEKLAASCTVFLQAREELRRLEELTRARSDLAFGSALVRLAGIVSMTGGASCPAFCDSPLPR